MDAFARDFAGFSTAGAAFTGASFLGATGAAFPSKANLLCSIIALFFATDLCFCSLL